MSVKNKSSRANRITSSLIWKRPIAFWLLPVIFLFLLTTLPLISQKYVSTSVLPLIGLISVIMSFILAHHYFSFLHRTDKSDFYFAMPASRTKMFVSLNLSALTYLIGPSLIVMTLNTILASLFNFNDPAMSWLIPSLSSLWIGYAGLIVRLIYLFVFLEICYFVTDKSTTANGMFILLNVFWPLMLFLFSDATSQFLPGFINPITTSSGPLLGHVFAFQLFSPMLFIGGLEQFHLLISVMGFGATALAYVLFRRRKAGYSPGLGTVNWPFQLTQWMGVMTVSLLGGYAAHHLRMLTTDTPGIPMYVSPAPFLIGTGLGLLMSLWVFNLIQGKGKIIWRALAPAAAVAVVPFAVWLAVVMTGAGGFSTNFPKAIELKTVTIHYSDAYASPFTGSNNTPYTFELSDPEDLALFVKLYEKATSSDNPGLATPRTLASTEQSKEFVRRLNHPEDWYDSYPYYPPDNDTYFALESIDGRVMERILMLPLSSNNPDYLNLLKHNRRFYLAELSGFPAGEKLQSEFELIVNPDASAKDREEWIDPLITALKSDEYFYDSTIRHMISHISSFLIKNSDQVFDDLRETAPCQIRITLLIPETVDANPADYELLLPVDPVAIPGLKEIIDQSLEIYNSSVQDEKNPAIPEKKPLD